MKRIVILFLLPITYQIHAQVNVYWDKRYGGNALDDAIDFEPTFDGGFILSGHSYSNASCAKGQNSQGSSDFWVVKTDASGNLQWEKSYGGSGYDSFARVKQTADSGFIIADRKSV